MDANSARIARAIFFSAALAFCALVAPPASAKAGNCAAIARGPGFEDTRITAATLFAANAAAGTPAYCEIAATISPLRYSEIGVVYRLPDNWNGKLLGLGGAGWAGNVSLARGSEAALKRGFATLQTDSGHAVGGAAFDTSWTLDDAGRANEIALIDFAYRGVHLMTVIGKEVAARYYARPQTRAYFQGCSTGGRQALVEAQRFPEDYDGIIAGAPVYDLLTQASALVRNRIFAEETRRLSAYQTQLINESVLDACDATDGQKDGMLADPRSCTWDPKVLQCRGGTDPNTCLSRPQVDAVRTAYEGITLKDGSVAAYPLSRGSETGWSRLIASATGPQTEAGGAGLRDLRSVLFSDPAFDLSSFDPERHLRLMRRSSFADAYEAGDPNISAFVARGGKLILWHGWNDPGPSPLGTISYYEAVGQVTLPQVPNTNLRDAVRLFVAPGVEHCGNGPGPDSLELLTPLDEWVEKGAAPARVTASKKDSEMQRPICAYPSVARYKGTGPINDLDSYECK